jgi:hypothetical protein
MSDRWVWLPQFAALKGGNVYIGGGLLLLILLIVLLAMVF